MQVLGSQKNIKMSLYEIGFKKITEIWMQVIGSHLAPAGEPVRQNSDNQSHQNKVGLKLLETQTKHNIFFSETPNIF